MWQRRPGGAGQNLFRTDVFIDVRPVHSSPWDPATTISWWHTGSKRHYFGLPVAQSEVLPEALDMEYCLLFHVQGGTAPL